jgi:hypothetical protein
MASSFRKTLGVGLRTSSGLKPEPSRPNFRTQDIVVDEAQARAHILSKQNSSTTLSAETPPKKGTNDWIYPHGFVYTQKTIIPSPHFTLVLYR